MSKFRKKSIIIEARQWFKYHLDDCEIGPPPFDINSKGEYICKHCGADYNKHGTIETLEGNVIVCQGDWIITGINGEFYPCKPDIFEKTYDLCED